ncbi:MAG: PTS glucitol/sorbitol transporter subunit IIA [Tissierellia bacterium]|nr:PTS glucitol/sorbitol transporter subunit IIA [Tissierellia bacterium]
MKIIYETKVNAIGDMVSEFEDDMIIFFGENAPDTLKDYCHIIDINEVKSDIKIGDILQIDDKIYKIKYVGDEAFKNLKDLGHLSVYFTEDEENLLPGSIVVENKQVPKIKIGSYVRIMEE